MRIANPLLTSILLATLVVTGALFAGTPFSLFAPPLLPVSNDYHHKSQNGNHLLDGLNASSSLVWNRTYGGLGDDQGYSVIETSDGGFAIAGSSVSFSVGFNDMWLVRLDTNGNPLWNRSYGGPDGESAMEVVLTEDGGFTLLGTTLSFGAGEGDTWLVHTDSQGNHLWNLTYGGTGVDTGYAMTECSDQGFAITGITDSFGAGDTDVWVVRTTQQGVLLWNRTYGGPFPDWGNDIVVCADGGFLIVGYSSTSLYGDREAWAIRTDSTGTVLWNRTYSYERSSEFLSVVATINGGFAFTGYVHNYNDDLSLWIVRTNSIGEVLWSRIFVHSKPSSMGWAITECADRGFAVAGHAGGSVDGWDDVWVVRTDLQGHHLWNRTYGGPGWDQAFGITVIGTSDILVVGRTSSYGAGYSDVWLLRMTDVLAPPPPVILFALILVICIVLIAAFIVVLVQRRRRAEK